MSFFKANYIGNLIQGWIPALDGVKERLEVGIKVADVGCGQGASTILMAEAFPNSTFTGFDYHTESVATASARVAERGIDGPARGAQAGETRLTDFVRGTGFDQVRRATETPFNLVIEVTD